MTFSYCISFGSSSTEVYTTSCSNVATMSPNVNVLLFCVVFLCGLERTVLFQEVGHCTKDKCVELFQESKDFQGARKFCKNSGGQLVKFNFIDSVIFTILPSGSYWLELDSTAEEAAEGLQNCSSISVSSVRSVPCRENLDGFLCQYAIQGGCSEKQTSGGAHVRYSTRMGVKLSDLKTFPSSTIAIVEKLGAKDPDSKHLCVAGDWKIAPWGCEVLKGGCEHGCSSASLGCTCPAGHILHPNKITCTADPCAQCEHECQKDGDIFSCKCRKGFKLAQDGRNCVDVNECEEEVTRPCTGEGEECQNTEGSYECVCADGFVPEDGVCVNVSICEKCEHMLCEKPNGVYECMCRSGYRVAPWDPTKCERYCTEKACQATCIKNRDNHKVDMQQCFCPSGYMLDTTDNTTICRDIDECEYLKQCDHKCENYFGGFKCSCNTGFRLHKEFECVPISKNEVVVEEEEEEGETGSGSTHPYPTASAVHPSAVPSYVKTGSALGIAVFSVLCVALLFLLVHNTVKRCGRFELETLKHPNIDIFYLQQVTTEAYRRLSIDKQFKSDSQVR